MYSDYTEDGLEDNLGHLFFYLIKKIAMLVTPCPLKTYIET